MTQPDLTLPDRAWNNSDFGPISLLAARTEADWLAILQGNAENPFSDLLEFFFGELPTGMPFPLALITALVRKLISDPIGSWNAIDDALDDLKTMLDEGADAVATVIDMLLGTGHSVADFVDWLQAVRDTGINSVNINTLYHMVVQFVAGMLDFLFGWVNIFTGGVGTPSREQLEAWVANTPILGDIVEVFTGVEDGDYNDLGSVVNQFFAPWRPVQNLGTGTVTTELTNYLINNTFNDAASMPNPPPGWEWDGTVFHVPPGGSAKVTANGTDRRLASNEVSVVAGQTLHLSAWAKWTSLTYTSTYPIDIGVFEYRGGNQVGVWHMDYLNEPAASGDWTHITGDYVVPAGVEEVRLLLEVDAETSAGTVWFDDCIVTKTDKISNYAAPGIQQSIDDTVESLFGWIGGPFSHSQAAAALRAQNDAVNTVQQQVQQLIAQQYTGIIAGDDFTYSGNPSAYWVLAYTNPFPGPTGYGYWQADGSSLYWVQQYPNGLRECMAFWNKSGENVSNTDYQIVTMTLSSAATVRFDGFSGANGLMARVNPWSSWVRFRVFGNGTCYLEYQGGIIVGPVGCGVPGGGSTLKLYAGWAGDPWRYLCFINNDCVIDWTDGGHGTSVGASNRYWGWDSYTDCSVWTFPAAEPGAMGQWLAMDQ